MYSIIGILTKPDDWDVARFRKWWVEEHAEMAKKLPGLRRYTIHPLSDGMDGKTGVIGGDPSASGIAFLWFDDKAAALAAFGSQDGRNDVESFNRSPVQVTVFGSDQVHELL